MSRHLSGPRAALFLLSASLITLSACSKPAEEAPVFEETVPTDTVADADATVETPSPKVDPAALPQLAYDYHFDLSAPDKKITAMMEGHQEACTIAGPATCQVLSLNSRTLESRGSTFHTLTLRATPQWIGIFRKNLANELKATGARIESQSIATEDVSLSIIDHEARIRNQSALRDNLQATLRTHKGKMSEVIELKEQLASIQADIDSATTAVATMKKRVAMSKLTLTYRPASSAAYDGTWAPLKAAVAGFGPSMVSALTVIITLFGYLLPVGLVAAPVIWWWRKRRSAQASQKA